MDRGAWWGPWHPKESDMTEHSTGRLAGRHGDTLATGNTQEVPNLGEMEHNGTFGCNKGLWLKEEAQEQSYHSAPSSFRNGGIKAVFLGLVTVRVDKLVRFSQSNGEGNGTPLQYSCLENPRAEESMGSLRVGHDWVTSPPLFSFMHWRRKWQPTPVFLPGESQGRGSLVGCCLRGRTESDMTEVT